MLLFAAAYSVATSAPSFSSGRTNPFLADGKARERRHDPRCKYSAINTEIYLAVRLKQHHVNSFGKSLNVTEGHETVPHCKFKKLLIFVIMETILCES